VSDSKDPKNYDDLKARLGLKKEPIKAAEPAPAASSGGGAVGEPDGERTPAGGFELNLERGGRVMDETEVDIDKAAAAMVTEGGPAISIKSSTGMRALVGLLLLLACGAAFAVGYSVKGTESDRMIQEHQLANAASLLKAVKTAKTGNNGQLLHEAVKAYSDKVDATVKHLQSAQTAKEITPAFLESVRGHIEEFHKASIAYVEQGPLLDAHSIIGKTVFNGEAVKLLLVYDKALKNAYDAAKMMAEEHVVLAEFKAEFKPKEIKLDSKIRAWRWASITVDGRPKGFLVGIALVTDDKGEIVYQKKDIVVPVGHQLPAGAATFEWMVKVKYDDPKQVGGETEGFVPTDVVVQWDLKGDILEPAKKLIAAHHQGYEQMLLRRLFKRVDAVKAAVASLPALHVKTVEKLAELTK
jgi:hypothetical protein